MRRHIAIESASFRSFAVLSLEEEQILTAEAASDEAEIATDLAEAERVIEVSDALEDLAVVADEIGEATPAETALVEIAGDMAVAGSDVEAEEIIPSMESYRGKRIATEGIRQTAQTIWANIMQFLKKVYKKIEGFFYKMFGTIPNLRKRIEDLEKAVDAASGKKLEEKKFSVSTGVAALSVDYKPVKTETELAAALKALSDASDDVYKKLMAGVAKVGEDISDVISDFDPEKAPEDQAQKLLAVVQGHAKDFKPSGNSTAPVISGYKVEAGAQLLGNVRLVKKVYESSESGTLGSLDRARRSGTELVAAREKDGTIPADFEFQTLSLAAASNILKEAANLLDNVEEYKRGKAGKEIEKAKTKLETASSKASKAFEKTKSSESDAVERAALPYYKSFLNFNAAYVRWVQQPAVPFTSHVLTTVRAALMIVQKSVAQYK